MQGIVKFWSETRGFGFVGGAGGTEFFGHISSSEKGARRARAQGGHRMNPIEHKIPTTITRRADGQLIARRGHVEWETPPRQPVPKPMAPDELVALVAHIHEHGMTMNPKKRKE